MAAEVLRRRAAFVAQYRWGLAFGVAVMITAMSLPLRPHDAPFVYDLIPLVALGAVWLGAGIGLGLVGRYWAQRASDAELPVARVERS